MNTVNFINTAVAINPVDRRPYSYGFINKPKLLFIWSRLLQSVISQAGTYLLHKKFHEFECGIYKAEGGCRIEGSGDLIVYDNCVRWDRYRHSSSIDKELEKLAKLITTVVLDWNPLNPIDSMIESAANFVKCDPQQLHEAISKSSNGGVFGSNALSSFFNYNPFGSPPENNDYLRWCRININKENPDIVNRDIEDSQLGRKLLEELIEACQTSNKYNSLFPLCCSPRRFNDDDLKFWINTGTTSEIDGWKSVEQIYNFINSISKSK